MTENEGIRERGKEEMQAPVAEEVVNPYALAKSSKKLLTLIGIYVCLIGTIIQSSTASTLLPIAAAQIGGMDIYSLANNLSGVVGVVAMPLWGYIVAKNPAAKKIMFVLSMICGIVCLCGRAVSPNMFIFIVFSLFWGFPSAGLYVVGYSMVRDMYDARSAGTYLGICATMQSIGMLVGPVLGGVVMDVWSWQAMCVIMAIIIAIGAVLVFVGVSVTKEQAAAFATAHGSFDVNGTLAVVVFLGCLICGLSLGGSFLRFGTMMSNIVFVVAALALVWLIVVIMRKKDNAVIPLSALKNRNTVVFTFGSFFSMFSNMAVFFFLPMYVLNVMNCSATQAGLTITMMSIAGLFMGPIYGRMIGKAANAKGVLAFGSVLRIVIAIVLMLYCAPDANIIILCVIMFIAGFYNTTYGVVFSAGPQVQLSESVRVQGNSIIQLGQNFGGSVGTAIYSIVIATLGVVQGMTVALIIAAVTAAVALVCALLLKKLPQK